MIVLLPTSVDPPAAGVNAGMELMFDGTTAPGALVLITVMVEEPFTSVPGLVPGLHPDPERLLPSDTQAGQDGEV